MARKKDCDSEPLNDSNPQERLAISNKKSLEHRPKLLLIPP
ncbi:hypothetical protein VCHA37P200_20080 [Vibrio chagasii]|nr:hypothetical protein VCHA34P117_150079 [Vibrio chagasii]CAH6850779.1 hypothetical protein VCHA34P120_10040 [Vibrio chagasii]CAH6854097.1 hypothetical protein VCHA34P129_200078 [Vibrio chagasii]CAH6883265.1 hypothetical protein VCHA36P164_20077 [Vibrio chagasii]CAH6946571.1 hypothetical protein VCHA48P439_150056 [Vibrio chagasii]